MSPSRLLLAFAFVSFAATGAAACPADLDMGFGDEGVAITDLDDNLVVSGNDSVLTGNGSILVAGSVREAGSNHPTPAIVRFTSDGEFDDTFGDGGVAQVSVEGVSVGIGLQDGGAIVAAFATSDDGDPDSAGVARFDEDGNLDTSFGDGGITVLDRGHAIIPRDLLVRSDGVVVVPGQENLETPPTNWRAHAYFFTADGDFDSALVFDEVPLALLSSVVEVDNKELIASGMYAGDGFRAQTFLTRIKSNGTLDATFGDEGVRRYPHAGFQEEAWQIARDASGRIYVAGNSTPADAPNRTRAFVRRFEDDGEIDRSYGKRGRAQIRFQRHLTIRGLAVSDDGEATASGYIIRRHFDLGLLVRFTPEGRRDPVFGDHGVVRLGLGSSSTQFTQVLLQDDGQLVATGSSPMDAIALRFEGVWNGAPICAIGCGDGHKSALEQCDDGNDVSGDGCSSICLNE